jgi:hypothetical protein
MDAGAHAQLRRCPRRRVVPRARTGGHDGPARVPTLGGSARFAPACSSPARRTSTRDASVGTPTHDGAPALVAADCHAPGTPTHDGAPALVAADCHAPGNPTPRVSADRHASR